MGKAAKGSRKGKKAWRANISTADIEDYLEKATRHDVASLEQLPDASLFQVQVQESTNKTNNKKKRKKTELHREKPLRHEAPLQKNPFLRPIPSSKLHPHPHPQPSKTTIPGPPHDSHSDSEEEDSDLNLDIWDAGNEEQQSLQKKSKHKPPPPAPVPAVEIEPLGCSFNPPFEAHQDALTKAVAHEMQKLYRKELQPDPLPLTVPGQLIPEEDKFFLDADDANDSDPDHIHQGQDPPPPSQRQSKTKKVTRVELNRRARRKELLRAEAQAKKIQTLSKQIDSIPGIMKEIEKEDEEKERKHTRRLVAKQERLKNAPPRLGKLKYVPPPVQVLLTEEITGSLCKLKGCCTLATDRFKSLEKRALIVPRSNKRSRN